VLQNTSGTKALIYQMQHEKGAIQFSGVQTHGGPPGIAPFDTPYSARGKIVQSGGDTMLQWEVDFAGGGATGQLIYIEAKLVGARLEDGTFGVDYQGSADIGRFDGHVEAELQSQAGSGVPAGLCLDGDWMLANITPGNNQKYRYTWVHSTPPLYFLGTRRMRVTTETPL